jgi:hypothetical protein
MTTPLHPDVEVLSFLLGEWRGEGRGTYPTIDDFAYREEVVFGHVGKPFVSYTQRTWALDDGRPLHSESGYLRPQPNDRLELVLALPSGQVEMDEGARRGGHIELTSTLVARTPSAKEVKRDPADHRRQGRDLALRRRDGRRRATAPGPPRGGAAPRLRRDV